MKNSVLLLVLLVSNFIDAQSLVINGAGTVYVSNGQVVSSVGGFKLSGTGAGKFSFSRTTPPNNTAPASKRVLVTNSSAIYEVRNVPQNQTAAFYLDALISSTREIADVSIENLDVSSKYFVSLNQTDHATYDDLPVEWTITKNTSVATDTANLTFTWGDGLEPTAISEKRLYVWNSTLSVWCQLPFTKTAVNESTNTLVYTGYKGALNNTKFMIATSKAIGNLTIVASGGETMGSTWTYDNGLIATRSASPVLVNVSDVNGYITTGDIAFEALNIFVNNDVVGPVKMELYALNGIEINANLKTTAAVPMILKGTTTVAAGKYIESKGAFTHDGNMTFKSNASGTAGFGPLGGSFTTVSGTATVERYIPANKRSFRFLSPSVTTTGTIRQNWQEDGGTAVGLGTHITGAGGADNGFDVTSTNNPSLYTFTSGAWLAVTNTNVNVLTAGTAYRLLVRGDRGINMSTNTPTPTNTTLRATGALKTGLHPLTLNQTSAGYSFIGNPYQAPVDIKAVLDASTNMDKDKVYYWDPTLNTRGGYVTRTLSTSHNTVTSSFNQYLQPGQAVFVQKSVTGAIATMSFNEIHKSMTNGAAGVFRADTTTSDYGLLRVNLQANVNNQWEVIEGALALFNPSYSWGATEEDANKLSNLDEEVSFMQNNSSLAIAMQSNPAATDELPMKLNNTRYTSYQWQFELSDYSGLTPYLLDTQNNTYTQIDNATIVPFTVNGQENTRFRIVFQNNALSTPTFDNQIVLYPNPASSSISGFYLQGITSAEVALHTILGQKIPVETTVNGSTLHVTTKQNVSKGVYVVSITQEGITSQVKWIVE